MSKKLYLCTFCRARIPEVGKALFVDQSTNRPFCSEKCIMEFHAPYMESFEREELEKRQELGLSSEEGVERFYQRHDLFQKALNAPDEVWHYKNPIGEEYHTHVAKLAVEGETIFYALVCSYFDDAPSFVFFKCITRSEELAKLFKTGNKKNFDSQGPELDLSDPSNSQGTFEGDGGESGPASEVQIPQETMEDLELKKSEYLAKLLEKRDEEDIPFENFGEYDEYLPKTIEDPDEIYSKEDESGDDVRTYIKSFQLLGRPFFYVVVCIKVALKEPEDHEALLPVISFPSTDQDLYKTYAVGERISEMLKN